MQFQKRTLRSVRIVFDPMAKVSHAIPEIPEGGCRKSVIGPRIDDQLDGRPLACAQGHPPLTVLGRRPIVKFAD